MLCLHVIFHMPSSNGSLVTTIKQKAWYEFCAATMLYPVQKIALTKDA
jgi:hypothetical protein